MLSKVDWSTVITALVGVATIFTYFRIGSNSRKYAEGSKLNDELTNLINLLMQYPFLEDPFFIKEYNDGNHRDDEKGMRYSAYCMLYVNYLGKVFDFCKGSKKKMLKVVNFRDWIYIHRQWWNNAQFASPETFDVKFRKILNEVAIEKAKKTFTIKRQGT
jgi:hypothetical protein